jgi:hypothetical protein
MISRAGFPSATRVFREFGERPADCNDNCTRTGGDFASGIMPAMRYRLIVCVLLLCAFTAIAQQPGRAVLEGVVVDQVTGEPVSQVKISQRPGTLDILGRSALNDVLLAQTGEDGRFRLENLPVGDNTLIITKAGYALQSDRRTLVAGLQPASLEVKMLPLGTISGRILDANGRPAPRVRVVTLFYRTVTDGASTLASLGAIATDDLGEFRLFDLRPGRYFINYSNSIMRGSMTEPDTVSMDTRAGSGSSQGLYPGVLRFDQALSVEVRGSDDIRLRDIVLTPVRYGSVRIRATNPPGESAKDVRFGFALSTPRISYSTIGSAVTGIGLSAPTGPVSRLDAGAMVETEYWPTQPGRYQVSVGWKNAENKYETLTRWLEFDGSSITLDATTAKPERKLSVRVLVENADGTTKPVEPIYVVFADSGVGRWTYHLNPTEMRPGGASDTRLLTGADGTGNIPLGPGRYELTTLSYVAGPGPADRYATSVRQGDRDVLAEGLVISDKDELVEVRMRSGAATIMGTVRDSRNQPVANAEVALVPQGAWSASRFINLRKLVVTRGDGSFQMTTVNPGTYGIYAWKAAGNPYRDPLFLKKFEGKETRVVVEPTRRISLDLKTLDE